MLRQYGVHLDGCISGASYGDCGTIIGRVSRNIASPRRLLERMRGHVVGGRKRSAVLTTLANIISSSRVSVLTRCITRSTVLRSGGGGYVRGVQRVYGDRFGRRVGGLRRVPNMDRHSTLAILTRVNPSMGTFPDTGRLIS